MFTRLRLVVIALCAPAIVCVCATPALAFDWAGKLERDLKLLRSPSATLRKRAVYRLGRYRKDQVKRYILRALRDIDPGVQQAAAEVAAEQRLAAAAPVFVGWMSHWEDSLRLAAADALGRIGGPLALKTLVRALVDPEPKVRLKIVSALAALADSSRSAKGKALRARAVVPLVGRLEDPNAGVRLAAVRALGQLGDKRAVIPLMGRLSDLGRKVRAESVTALGKLGDPRSGPAITRLLSDHAPGVVQAAIKTLGLLRYRGATEPLIEMLRSSSSVYRGPVAQALARIGTDLAIRSLVTSLGKSTLASAAKAALGQATKQNPKHINWLLKDPRTPRSVALVAVEIAREAKLRGAVPLLVEQLQLKRLPRAILINALGAIGDRRAQRPLLGLLDANSVDVQLAALKALNKLIDGRAAEPLVRCLASRNRAVRRHAIDYLGRLRARIATPALIRLARKTTGAEARQAAAALAAIGDPQATDEMLRLLVHHDRLLRRIAVQGLSGLAPAPKVARRVLKMCKRQSLAVRSNCLQALGNLLRGSSDRAVIDYLASNVALGDHTLFLSALDGLAAMRDARIAKVLLRRIPKLPLVLKRHAVEVLGNQLEARALTVGELRKLLGSPESAVRGAAAWALGKLRATSARDELARVAQGKGWAARINATAALAALRDPASAATLRSLTTDRDPYVRANALLGLGWLAASAKPSMSQLARRAQQDRSPWARVNALRALIAAKATRLTFGGQPMADARALAKEMAKSDPDQRVRHIASKLAERAPTRGRGARSAWIGLYLLDGEGQPLRDKPYVLVTPEGLAKASHADMRSQGWEEHLPEGRCYVELPARRPRVPPQTTE